MNSGVPSTAPSRVAPSGARLLDEPRDAEVAELDELAERRALELDARAHEHHVVGLEVAVDDAEPVRLGERAARIGDDAEREPLGKLAEPRAARARDAAAGDELEHEVVQPAILVEVDEVRDERAADLREHARFLAEPAQQLGVVGDLGRSSLIATFGPPAVSRASQTSPIAPAPRRRASSNRPSARPTAGRVTFGGGAVVWPPTMVSEADGDGDGDSDGVEPRPPPRIASFRAMSTAVGRQSGSSWVAAATSAITASLGARPAALANRSSNRPSA